MDAKCYEILTVDIIGRFTVVGMRGRSHWHVRGRRLALLPLIPLRYGLLGMKVVLRLHETGRGKRLLIVHGSAVGVRVAGHGPLSVRFDETGFPCYLTKGTQRSRRLAIRTFRPPRILLWMFKTTSDNARALTLPSLLSSGAKESLDTFGRVPGRRHTRGS